MADPALAPQIAALAGNALKRAEELVSDSQLESPARPTFAAALSPLSSLSDSQVVDELQHWSAFAGYAKYRAAVLRAAAGVAKTDFELEFDSCYASSTELTVSDKRHLVGNKPAVRNKKAKAAQLDADAEVLEAVAYAYELRFQAASRELSRRRSDKQ